MKIELPKSEFYYHFASRLEATLPETKATWLPFLSVEQALFDLTSAMALTYSHKMSLAVVGEESPYFKRMSVHFSRLGYNVQSLKREEMAKSLEWIESLNNHTLFVLAEEDDVLTGELFDQSRLTEKLNEKKIFQILISHNQHRCKEWVDFGGFESRIYSTENGRALLGLGTRAKIQPVHVLGSDFRYEKLEDYNPGFDSHRCDAERVKNFEKDPAHGAKPYFTGEQRLYDRAALVFSGVSADAVRGEVLADLPAEQHSSLVSLSLCQWKELDDHSGLKPSSDELLLIDQSIISEQLASRLHAAYERVLEMQGG